MIVHGEYTMPVALHGIPLWSTWQRPTATKTWFGVAGALTTIGKNTVRQGTIDATLMNFSTYALLQNTLNSMDAQLDNCLKGTLNVDGIEYPRCLFLGFEQGEPAQWDASLVHGWVLRGRLRWKQTR